MLTVLQCVQAYGGFDGRDRNIQEHTNRHERCAQHHGLYCDERDVS